MVHSTGDLEEARGSTMTVLTELLLVSPGCHSWDSVGRKLVNSLCHTLRQISVISANSVSICQITRLMRAWFSLAIFEYLKWFEVTWETGADLFVGSELYLVSPFFVSFSGFC